MMNACTQHDPNLNDQQINEVIPMLLKAHLEGNGSSEIR